MRNGKTQEYSVKYAEREWIKVAAAIQHMSDVYGVTTLNIFDPSNNDIKILSTLSKKSELEVRQHIETAVYPTKGTSRLPINKLVRIYFFHVKPFLPRFLRNIQGSIRLKKLFYRF
jgi:hypothetical protein